MKQEHLNLSPDQYKALKDLQNRIQIHFEIEKMMVFGSIVRQSADEESDIDVLILTKQTLSRLERHKITDIAFEINLQYQTNFSTLVLDIKNWDSGVVSTLPIKQEILGEGVPV